MKVVVGVRKIQDAHEFTHETSRYVEILVASRT